MTEMKPVHQRRCPASVLREDLVSKLELTGAGSKSYGLFKRFSVHFGVSLGKKKGGEGISDGLD